MCNRVDQFCAHIVGELAFSRWLAPPPPPIPINAIKATPCHSKLAPPFAWELCRSIGNSFHAPGPQPSSSRRLGPAPSLTRIWGPGLNPPWASIQSQIVTYYSRWVLVEILFDFTGSRGSPRSHRTKRTETARWLSWARPGYPNGHQGLHGKRQNCELSA